MKESLEDKCNRLRASLKAIEKECRAMMKDEDLNGESAFEGQRGEQKASCMLTVRHIEDARMRLGKVIQYNGDGVSCYDK